MDLTISPYTKQAATMQLKPNHDREDRLWAAARELEAAFLSEMLGHATLGKPSEAFGGGAGEAHFSSFLRDAQARNMAANRGIGLAEAIFRSLKGASNV